MRMSATHNYRIGQNSIATETAKAWCLTMPKDANEFAGYSFWTPKAGSLGGHFTERGGFQLLQINFYCDSYKMVLKKSSGRRWTIVDEQTITGEQLKAALKGSKWDYTPEVNVPEALAPEVTKADDELVDEEA